MIDLWWLSAAAQYAAEGRGTVVLWHCEGDWHCRVLEGRPFVIDETCLFTDRQRVTLPHFDQADDEEGEA